MPFHAEKNAKRISRANSRVPELQLLQIFRGRPGQASHHVATNTANSTNGATCRLCVAARPYWLKVMISTMQCCPAEWQDTRLCSLCHWSGRFLPTNTGTKLHCISPWDRHASLPSPVLNQGWQEDSGRRAKESRLTAPSSNSGPCYWSHCREFQYGHSAEPAAK
jgi:hypothetical protein